MNKKRGRGRKPQQGEKEKSELDVVVDDFVACGRCSFFLAGYRVIHGLEALREAAEASGEDWITLRWDHATRRLVQDSYGSRLDIEFYYFDGRCPECQRRFVIGAEDAGAEMVAEEAQGDGDEAAWELPEPSMLRVALTAD